MFCDGALLQPLAEQMVATHSQSVGRALHTIAVRCGFNLLIIKKSPDAGGGVGRRSGPLPTPMQQDIDGLGRRTSQEQHLPGTLQKISGTPGALRPRRSHCGGDHRAANEACRRSGAAALRWINAL